MCIVSPQDTCRYLSLGGRNIKVMHGFEGVCRRGWRRWLDPWSVVVITFTIIPVPSSPAHRLESSLLKSLQEALERAGQASGGTIYCKIRMDLKICVVRLNFYYCYCYYDNMFILSQCSNIIAVSFFLQSLTTFAWSLGTADICRLHPHAYMLF